MWIKPNYSKDLLEVRLRLGSVLTPKVKLVLTKLMIIALIMLEPFQYVAFHRFCIFTTKTILDLIKEVWDSKSKLYSVCWCNTWTLPNCKYLLKYYTFSLIINNFIHFPPSVTPTYLHIVKASVDTIVILYTN